ncbi:MAG TPA: PAS domain S-box protein [Chroococcidiopsis sp.]
MSTSPAGVVLVVDDQPALLQPFCQHLKTAGFEVRQATRPEEAIALVQSVAPDVIVLDHGLPDGDCLEFCRQLRSRLNGQAIPILLMTAEGETVDKAKGFAASNIDYLAKPIDPDEGLHRIHLYLRLRYLTRALLDTETELQEAIAHSSGNTAAQGPAGVAAADPNIWASEERYRLLTDVSVSGIWLASASGVLVSICPRLMALLGSTSAELAGAAWLTIVHPDDRDRTAQEWRSALAAGKRYDIECRLRVADGGYHTMRWCGVPILDDHGRIREWAGTCTDISDRKQTETALQESHEIIIDILESITDGFAALDRNWRFTYVNSQAEQILQRSEEELLGQVLWDLYPEGSGGRFHQHYQRAMHEGITVHFEAFYSPLNSWLELHVYPIKAGIAVYFRDVSDRKRIEAEHQQAETALSESEHRYRLLFEQNPNPMWVVDTESLRFIAVNAAAIRHYGYSKDEFLSMTALDIRPAADGPKITQFLREQTELTTADIGVWQHHKKDGTVIDVEVSAMRITWEGKPAIVTMINDITERRRAEQYLQASQNFLHAIINGVVDPLFVKDAQHLYRFVSDSFCEFLERNRDEIIGKTDYDLFPPDFAQSYIQTDQQIFDMQIAQEHVEHVPSAKTGDIQVLSTKKACFSDVAGNQFMVATIRDITERERIGQQLQSSEHFLHAILNGVPDPLFVKNQRHQYIVANDMFCKLVVGRDRDAVLGKTDHDLFPADQADFIQQVDQRVFDSGLDREDEETLTDGQGNTHILATRKSCFDDSRGDRYLVGTIRNITDRRRIEDTLRNITLGVSGTNPQSLFQSLVKYLAKALNANYAFVAEHHPLKTGRMRTVAAIADGVVMDNFEYELMGTPCERVLGNTVCIYPDHIQQLFPDDRTLAEMQAESYIGVPLFDSKQQLLGLLTVLSRQPLPDTHYVREILQIFSVRAAAELERARAEEALRCLNGELESRVNLRTAELASIVEQLQQEIQGRRQSEMALNEAYQRLRFHMENTPLAVIEWDSDFLIKHWSSKAEQLFGWTAEEVIGRSHHQVGLVPEADRALVSTGTLALRTGNQSSNMVQNRNYTRSGEILYCEWYNSVLLDSAGNFVSVLSLVLDVTERQQTEVALRQSEQRFRAMFEQAAVGITLADCHSGQFVRVNHRFCEMVGYSREELMTKSWRDITHPDHLSETIFERLKRGELGSVSKEKRYICKDGTALWTAITLSVVYDTNGMPLYEICVIEDIGDRKRAEAERRQAEAQIRRSEANLAAAQRVAHIGSWEFDSRTQAQVWSEEMFRIYGLEPAAIAPTYAEMLQWVHPDDRDWVNAQNTLEQCQQTGTFQTFEHRLVRPDGAVRSVEVRGEAIFNSEGQVEKLFGTVLDITDRKLAENKLTASLEEKELLLKEVHHRVKNNLQVISSLFSLQSQYISDPKILAVLQESQERIYSMALVHEKLYQDDLTHINFTDYIQSLTNHLFASYNINSTLIQLELQIADVMLTVDTAIRCGLMVNELVANALKHGFPDRRSGTISISLLPNADGLAELTVADTGVGLPPDFDLQHSTSLGLRLVRTLARKMKGTLDIFHRNGAIFQITFPAEWQ